MTEIFVLAGILIQVGFYLQTSRSNTKAIDSLSLDLKEHKEQVWPRISANEVEIAKVKGHLGMNGGDYPQRGKAHHQ